MIGRLTVEFAQGAPLTVALDRDWRVAATAPTAWTMTDFDDRAWVAAKPIAPYGQGPWGRVGTGQLTLSPVTADPFDGHVDLPADFDLGHARVYLELGELAPEAAARVTVNGTYAGGFLGLPFRLEVTSQLRAGRTTLRIEPFAPKTAQLVTYE